MTLIKAAIKNDGDAWAIHKRYKVNDVVVYLGVTYQNTTGYNSQPYDGSPDWVVVFKEPTPVVKVQVNGNPFFLIKHPQNNAPGNELVLEANDYITNGFWDSQTFWVHAFFNGGDPDIIGNWTITGEVSDLVLS